MYSKAVVESNNRMVRISVRPERGGDIHTWVQYYVVPLAPWQDAVSIDYRSRPARPRECGQPVDTAVSFYHQTVKTLFVFPNAARRLLPLHFIFMLLRCE